MPTTDAAPPPAAWYTDPDAFMRERRHLFADAWQMLARADALKAPGDYVCNNLAGLAVFVMRDERGGLGAFSNVCRHQKLPVLDAGAGHCALLRCRYHGWTYHFDGSFKEAPPKYAPADPANAENNLQPVRLAEWRGFLFVTAGAAAPDLATETAPLEAALAARLAAPLAAAGEIVTDLQCNWKIAVERFLAPGGTGEGDGEGAVRLWHFPSLMLELHPSALLAHQLVARTHERSRIVTHVLVADPAAGAALMETARTARIADKAACEVLQAKAAAGGPTDTEAAAPGSALAAFHARVRAAHAKAESA
ncbi:MAG TPA: Rieske (2Fe-2S) protein [Alphaproteobacteria bacterium]|nr:Rieske (2Fe-2S) protein [Alphaproteobacteria bacterium]